MRAVGTTANSRLLTAILGLMANGKAKMSDSEASIQNALATLGVQTAPASPNFREWLTSRISVPTQAGIFMECLPATWSWIKLGDWDLCFLADERGIIDNSRRLADRDLLFVGSFMDGGAITLDLSNRTAMMVGRIGKEAWLGESSLERKNIHSFRITYSDWLRQIAAHPEDNRFL